MKNQNSYLFFVCPLHYMQNSKSEMQRSEELFIDTMLEMPWRRHRPVNAARECWGSVMNQDGGFKQEVTISMQTQQPWVRQVMPGWVYHWALGQVSVAGGGGGAAAGAVAGGFGDGGFGNAGTETRRPTARQSRAPADSPWEPLWTAACPCRWGMGGVGIGNQTQWGACARSHTNVKWHFHSSYMKTKQMQIVVLWLHVCAFRICLCVGMSSQL